MSYTVKSSEKLRTSGADMETKALLYLMNFHSDGENIYYYVVDFFNDLTGMDSCSQQMWDLQSKAEKSPSPKAVGESLVTLFKNYSSDFEFKTYILFLGGVNKTLRIDSSKFCFDVSNVACTALLSVKEGLRAAIAEKTYIENKIVTDYEIDDFLKKVFFVIDDKTKEEYIKSIIKVNDRIIPHNSTLIAIFNEIKAAQSSKKDMGCVEGLTIETCDQALNYGRHLTKNEIKMLVLNRVINCNPMGKGVPIHFIPIYSQFPPESQAHYLEDCKLALAQALFNKNNGENFWRLFENIYTNIIASPALDVEYIYRLLDPSIIKSCSCDFDTLSLKYLISLIKDGIQ